VRASRRRQRGPATGGDGKVRFGDVEVDVQNRSVVKAGRAVRLTPTEHRLLAVLVANAGKVMTTPQLLRAVWGPHQADNAHYLRIYMGHLRHKLEDNPAQPRYMMTETGVGYRFQLP
jgi:two-component system KDP operon response regulator KdpE